MKMSYSQIEAQCNELHTVANNIKAIFEKIESIQNQISNGNSWSGNASNNYVKNLRTVTKNFDSIVSDLEISILFMAKCSEDYQALDKLIIKELDSNLKFTESEL